MVIDRLPTYLALEWRVKLIKAIEQIDLLCLNSKTKNNRRGWKFAKGHIFRKLDPI